jgi:hypothetical protein
MTDYSFRKIEKFNLDRYSPLIGWIGDKPQKIYSKDGSEAFYLFDELSRQLFEFDVVAHLRWKDSEEYERIVRAFCHRNCQRPDDYVKVGKY